MRRLLEFLLQNPILLLVIGAWIFGMIGNILKAAKKAREKAERSSRAPEPRRAAPAPAPATRSRPQPAAAESGNVRSAEEIAREMRRILGEDPARGDRAPAEASRGDVGVDYDEPPVAATPPPLPERIRRRNVPEPERAPTPVVPTTSARRLQIHVDPHVGESIQHRATVSSGRVGDRAAGAELGSLGGRTHERHRQRAKAGRYALVDLKRIIVLNEILGPPLALRRAGDRDV